jgi:hypothetical protein
VKREVRQLVDRIATSSSSHIDRGAIALAVADVADRMAREEVMAARSADGATWQAIGDGLGVSRQSAHERFRTGPDGMHTRLFKRVAVESEVRSRSTRPSTSGSTRRARPAT